MAWAKLTLIGLETYEQSHNPPRSIFSGLTVPADTQLDKDLLVNTILLRGGELGALYSDPDMMRFAIGAWSDTHQDAMSRMYRALTEEYDPLHNYNRMEEESTSGARSGTESSTGTDAGSSSRSSSRSESDTSTGSTHTDGETVNEQENTAYDSATYAKVQKDTSTVGDSQSTVSASQSKGDDNETSSESRSRADVKNSSETHGDARTLHAFGNIGVTTSATMATEEMMLRKTWNIYETIAEMLISELCVLVW